MDSIKVEKRISDFLASVNVCVLCTSKNDVPRATPIEYYSEGTTIYIFPDQGTKIVNIEVNPRVSIGIYNTPYTNWTDWYRVIGIQITGEANLLVAENPEYTHALEVYQWQLYHKARGMDLSKPPKRRYILKITAIKIEYRELALMREGYCATQVWEA